ncbi:sulfite exporter TauE/SafE family protein [Cryobacterium psychrophilum]
MTILVLVAVFVGASMQRITGMGLALVAAPFLVLLLGPIDGIVLVNACAILTAGLILPRVIRHISWRRYAVLASFALLGIVPGAVVVQQVPGAWLQISIGLLLATALTVSVTLRRASLRDSPGVRAVAGAASGFMNATAGLGGPAVSMYAMATHWSQRGFAATMQPYFITISGASLVAKLVFGGAEPPQLTLLTWLLIAAACTAGLLLGELLARVIEPNIARRMLVVIAYVGAAGTIVRGFSQL